MIVTSIPTQQQQKFKTWMYVAGENWKVTLLFEHPSYYRILRLNYILYFPKMLSIKSEWIAIYY